MRHPMCTCGKPVNDTPDTPYDSRMLDPRKFRRARLAAGMTPTDVAYLARASERAVRYWEAGEKIPRPGTAERLADALGVHVDDITV